MNCKLLYSSFIQINIFYEHVILNLNCTNILILVKLTDVYQNWLYYFLIDVCMVLPLLPE